MERPKVLLVEDNILLRWSIKNCLDHEGYSVAAPGTVEEALRTGMARTVDMLITDCELPGGHDGFEVLAGLRQIYPEMLAVLISADADEELTVRALRAGFSRVIQKPFQEGEVLAALRGLQKENGAEVPA